MFVGHYATAVATKALDRRLPLWALFLAVQLLDVAWGALVVAGVEHVRIVPGFTESNALDLYDFPWSHSLAAAAAWALGAGILWTALRARGPEIGPPILIALAVFAHWGLDWLVHPPDLRLYPGGADAYGLGLWNHFAVETGIEAAMYVVATALYFRATRPRTGAGRWAVPALGVLLMGAQLSQKFGPPPPSALAIGATALAGFALFAALAAWAERKRL
jgi:hypothetical protein